MLLDHSRSYRHTQHEPGYLSTTGTPFPPSKPQFVHMLQRRPGPTSPRPYTASPAGTPPPTQEQGRCCHRRANTLAAFGPPSKPRHSSRAEPQQDLNPFSFSFGKENKQGMWHSERGKINARLHSVFEREMKFNRLYFWTVAQDTKL